MSALKYRGKRIKVKTLSKSQFEDIGVFIDMTKIAGKEYITVGGDEDFVEIVARYKITLPITAVEFLGDAQISPNSKLLMEASEETKQYQNYENSKKHRFKKRLPR